jgi:hypothetical protein
MCNCVIGQRVENSFGLCDHQVEGFSLTRCQIEDWLVFRFNLTSKIYMESNECSSMLVQVHLYCSTVPTIVECGVPYYWYLYFCVCVAQPCGHRQWHSSAWYEWYVFHTYIKKGTRCWCSFVGVALQSWHYLQPAADGISKTTYCKDLIFHKIGKYTNGNVQQIFDSLTLAAGDR